MPHVSLNQSKHHSVCHYSLQSLFSGCLVFGSTQGNIRERCCTRNASCLKTPLVFHSTLPGRHSSIFLHTMCIPDMHRFTSAIQNVFFFYNRDKKWPPQPLSCSIELRLDVKAKGCEVALMLVIFQPTKFNN